MNKQSVTCHYHGENTTSIALQMSAQIRKSSYISAYDIFLTLWSQIPFAALSISLVSRLLSLSCFSSVPSVALGELCQYSFRRGCWPDGKVRG